MGRSSAGPAWLLAAALWPAALGAAGPAAAAEDEDVTWSFSGEARFRPEWRDDADLDAGADDDRRQGFMRLRLAVGAEWKGRLRLFFQAQDSRVAGEEPATASSTRNLDLHQGFLDVGLTAGGTVRVRIGRQEIRYGDERLIGAFGWDNVGRSFDGARLRAQRGRATVDGFVAREADETDPSSGATTGSDLYGVYAQWARRPGAEYEAYWLGWGSRLEAAGDQPSTSGTSRVHVLGARVKDRRGRLDGLLEAAAERGRVAGDDLAARAAAVQAGWSFGSGTTVRLFAGYDYATGEEDPADGERREFFNFFPTNHPHYGYMDYQGWRNLRSPHAGIAVVRGRHTAQAKAHRFDLDEPRGPWKSAGGQVLGHDPAGTSGRRVGSEIDLTWRYAWSGRAVVEGGYSRFRPGEFARSTRGPDPSDWAYVMMTATF
jgi:hypothetical protein